MRRRSILLVCIVVLVYFSLSLYHSDLSKKLARNRAQQHSGEDWIQLTTESVPQEGQGKTAEAPRHNVSYDSNTKELSLTQTPAGSERNEDDTINILRQRIQESSENNEKLRILLTNEKETNKILSQQINDLHARLSLQQKELQQANTLLHERNQSLEASSHEINKLRNQLSKKGRQQDSEDTKLTNLRKENRKLLAEIGRLNNQLKELKISQSNLKQSAKKAQLKAEAMMRYGQEQDKKLASAKEQLQTLLEASRKVNQTNQAANNPSSD